jgi:competence protein ComEA
MREQRNNAAPPTVGARRWWFVVGAFLAILIFIAIIDFRGLQRIAPPKGRPAIVNVNRATLSELTALPNIRAGVAQAIIDGRPYSSTDDLIRVYGIGPKTLEAIRPYVKVNDDNLQP